MMSIFDMGFEIAGLWERLDTYVTLKRLKPWMAVWMPLQFVGCDKSFVTIFTFVRKLSIFSFMDSWMHFSTNIKYFHVIDELLACLQLELIPNYLFSNCKKKKKLRARGTSCVHRQGYAKWICWTFWINKWLLIYFTKEWFLFSKHLVILLIAWSLHKFSLATI